MDFFFLIVWYWETDLRSVAFPSLAGGRFCLDFSASGIFFFSMQFQIAWVKPERRVWLDVGKRVQAILLSDLNQAGISET